MKSMTAMWFVCTVALDRVTEDGCVKKVTEKYVVNALSFTEAEVLITQEISAYAQGEFEVKDITLAPYSEIFFMNYAERMLANQTEDLMHAVKKGDKKEGSKVYNRKLEEYNSTDSRWYKAKVAFLTLDEKTGKEKRNTVVYLVEASSVHGACNNIDSIMQGSMLDYEITDVSEQRAIVDVFVFKSAGEQ